MNQPRARTGPALPWWRVRMVWVMIGGPAVVVVAALATLVIAVRGGDVPLRQMATAAESAAESPSAHTPATQARNHAASAHR